MDQVEHCLKGDIPGIAKLHLKVYGNPNDEPSKDLLSYYETVLFSNPWCDEEIPPLVFRSKDGIIEGLLGVLVHRMNYNGKSIRMAVPHSLMMAPDCSSPMAVVQMIRKFFEGPQDLVIGDGANDQARKLMEAMGAMTSYLYSMHWLCLLRPCSYMGSALKKKRGLQFLSALLRPTGFVLDALANKVGRNRTRPQCSQKCTAVELDSQSLQSCISEFTKRSPLYPEYKSSDIQWFWSFLQSNTQRGRSQGFEVHNEKGQRIGYYLYFLKAKKFMEVVTFWAREDSTDVVFSHLMDHAFRQGVLSVEGRMEPRFLQAISDHNCLIKHRRWTIEYSKTPEILDVLNRGDAMLTPMEGELWVHSLSDKLHL